MMTKIQHLEIRGEHFALVPQKLYDEMSAAMEAMADARTFDEALAKSKPTDFLSDSEMKRLLDGESAIRVWREHRSLALQSLAMAAGIGKTYLSEIETGKKSPSLHVLRSIAQALSVDIDDLA